MEETEVSILPRSSIRVLGVDALQDGAGRKGRFRRSGHRTETTFHLQSTCCQRSLGRRGAGDALADLGKAHFVPESI